MDCSVRRFLEMNAVVVVDVVASVVVGSGSISSSTVMIDLLC